MKFKAIAKASLALGMLATGVITSNVQSVQAKTEVKQQSESELKHYYNKPVLERKNVTGYKYTEKGKDYIDVIVDNQYSQISLVGSDKDKFKDGDNSNIDVFILREGDSRQATNYSIGGVTKQTVNLLLTIYTHQSLKSRKVKKNHKVVYTKFIKKTSH